MGVLGKPLAGWGMEDWGLYGVGSATPHPTLHRSRKGPMWENPVQFPACLRLPPRNECPVCFSESFLAMCRSALPAAFSDSVWGSW